MLEHKSELDHRMSKSLEEMAQDLFKSVVGGFSVFVPSDGLTGAHAEQAEGPFPHAWENVEERSNRAAEREVPRRGWCWGGVGWLWR